MGVVLNITLKTMGVSPWVTILLEMLLDECTSRYHDSTGHEEGHAMNDGNHIHSSFNDSSI